jgi:hypothetical protein
MGGWRGPKPAYAVAFDSCSSSLKRPASVAADAGAIEIQRHYLDAVERHLDRLPDWTESVCTLWRRALDDLALGGTAAGVALDWAIKHRIYTHRLAKHGLSWNTLDAWNRVINRSWHLHGHSGERFTIETALEGPRQGHGSQAIRQRSRRRCRRATADGRRAEPPRHRGSGPAAVRRLVDVAEQGLTAPQFQLRLERIEPPGRQPVHRTVCRLPGSGDVRPRRGSRRELTRHGRLRRAGAVSHRAQRLVQQPFQALDGRSVFPNIAFGRDSFNALSGSLGLKANLLGRVLVDANLLFKLDEHGLRDKVTPLIGLEYSF